ncbi:MAG TPA: VOC family protein [Burkholderiaceae bacterium]|nr:VOC family protein [Burkholderiaceae bacterium]
MPVLAFNHFNLRAPTVLTEALKDFYVDVVGLSVGWRPPFDFPGYWLYLGEQAVLHLVGVPAAREALARGGTFDHVAFTCTGLAETEARLSAQGVEYRSVRVPGTEQVQLFLTDPAGNGVELNFASASA